MIRFSPQRKSVGITPYFVTVGWDGWLKVWNLNYTPRFSFKAHDNNINAVAISPLFGNLIATGGKDKKLYVWDITDLKKPKFEYEAGSTINSVLLDLYIFRLHSIHSSPGLPSPPRTRSESGP
jgi:guanine nucleotide-binding protein subunit beta-2-like 1 protein